MKRIVTQMFAFGTLFCTLVSAEDMILKSGKQLKDAVVSRKGIDHVIVRHSSGVQRVDYDELTFSNQERYGMTPDAVEKRRAEQKAKVDAASEKRERESERYMKLLKDSHNLPRYMKASDLRSMYLHYGEMSDVAAEYLAAEWNRRESIRLNLPEEVKRYTEYANMVRDAFNREVERERESVSEQKREVEQIRLLRQELKLAKQREEAWKAKEEEYAEKLEEADDEYRDLWKDYQRERNANRIRYNPHGPIYIQPNRGRTINF